MAPKRHPPGRRMADAGRRVLFPPKVALAVALLLLSTSLLAGGICFLAVNGVTARWLLVAGGAIGLLGLVLAVRYRIASRTAADERHRSR